MRRSKKWVVQTGPSNWEVVSATGFKPQGAVSEAPPELDLDDGPFITSVVDDIVNWNAAGKSAKDNAKVQRKIDNEHLDKRRLEFPVFEQLLEAIMEDRDGRPEKMNTMLERYKATIAKYPKN